MIFEILKIAYLGAKYKIFSSFLVNKQYKIFILVKFFEKLIYPKNIFQDRKIFGDNLRDFLTELGPIYIKFGQILSSNVKLVGNKIAAELKLLQDSLPPIKYEEIIVILEKSLDQKIDKLFLEFEKKPVSTASVAQVHKAKIFTGEQVAVKILRPNIHKIYKKDLKFLKILAKYFQYFFYKLRRLDLLAIVNLLENIMSQELNLLLEASHYEEFRRNIAQDKKIYIPKIYWNFTNKDILTTEWVDGKKVYEISDLPVLDRINIAENLAVMFFNQTFRDGFFHADLHPGNILITEDYKIILVDFGIVSRLNNKDRLLIAEILYCFLVNDYLKIAQLHLKAGYIPVNSNLDLFAYRCKKVYQKLQKNSEQDFSIAELISDLFSITEEFGMKTQIQLILLQKNMLLLEGVSRIICPSANLWELARPYVAKWARKNLTFEAKIIRVIKDLFHNLV